MYTDYVHICRWCSCVNDADVLCWSIQIMLVNVDDTFFLNKIWSKVGCWCCEVRWKHTKGGEGGKQVWSKMETHKRWWRRDRVIFMPSQLWGHKRSKRRLLLKRQHRTSPNSLGKPLFQTADRYTVINKKCLLVLVLKCFERFFSTLQHQLKPDPHTTAPTKTR